MNGGYPIPRSSTFTALNSSFLVPRFHLKRECCHFNDLVQQPDVSGLEATADALLTAAFVELMVGLLVNVPSLAFKPRIIFVGNGHITVLLLAR